MHPPLQYMSLEKTSLGQGTLNTKPTIAFSSKTFPCQHPVQYRGDNYWTVLTAKTSQFAGFFYDQFHFPIQFWQIDSIAGIVQAAA